MSKLTLLTAAAAGYVLGARAGRDRYEQIASTARSVMGNPKVQAAKQQAQDVATEKARVAASTVASKVRSGSDEPAGTHVAEPTLTTETSSPTL